MGVIGRIKTGQFEGIRRSDTLEIDALFEKPVYQEVLGAKIRELPARSSRMFDSHSRSACPVYMKASREKTELFHWRRAKGISKGFE